MTMEYHPFNVEIPKIPPFDRHPEQRPNMVARSGLMIVEGKGNHPKKKRLHLRFGTDWFKFAKNCGWPEGIFKTYQLT